MYTQIENILFVVPPPLWLDLQMRLELLDGDVLLALRDVNKLVQNMQLIEYADSVRSQGFFVKS